MLSERLLEELRQLSRADKLRLVQLLAGELAQEEDLLGSPLAEVWSPLDAAGAAATLNAMLEEERPLDE